MPRPCTCDRFVKGSTFVHGRDCRRCWLFHHDDRYKQRWSEEGPPPAPAQAVPLPVCRHRGDATGEVLTCTSCNQHTSRHPVFACEKHTSCTAHKSFAGHACCRVCDDYALPPEAVPATQAQATGVAVKESDVPHHWDLRVGSATEWVEQLFEQAPGPWPKGWENYPNVQEAFRRLFDRALNYCPPRPDRAGFLRAAGLQERLPGVWTGGTPAVLRAFHGHDDGLPRLPGFPDAPPATPPRLCARFLALHDHKDWVGHERIALEHGVVDLDRIDWTLVHKAAGRVAELRRQCAGIVLHDDCDGKLAEIVLRVLAVAERENPEEETDAQVLQTAYRLAGTHGAVLGRPILDPSSPWLYPRGVVIYGGGWKYFPGIYVVVRMLRHLGCTLPIQVWCLGDKGEFDIRMHQATQDFNVEWLDANDLWRKTPGMALRRDGLDHGWMLKSYACLWSGFADVLGLDADSYPVRNPDEFFDDPEYRRLGAALWPDQADFPPSLYQKFGVSPPAEGFSIESGQCFFDKTRHFEALWLATWLNTYWDYTYHCGPYGDKDMLQLAWLKYYQTHTPPETTATGLPFLLVHRKPTWRKVAFLCYDRQRQVLFVHRCRDKFRFSGKLDGLPVGNRYATTQNTQSNQFFEELPGEAEAFHFYREIDLRMRPQIQTRSGRAGEWDREIWASVVLRGEYALPASFQEGDVVVDVGCHIGAFSWLALSRGAAAVLAVEANPESFHLALANLSRYPDRPERVATTPCILWRSDGQDPPPFALQPHDTQTGNSGSYTVMGLGLQEAPFQETPFQEAPFASSFEARREVKGLDELLRGLPHVRLLKIDCEGSEYPILMTSRYLDRVEEIVGEYHRVDKISGSAQLGEYTRYDERILKEFLRRRGFVVEILPQDDYHGLFRAVRSGF